ncbi:hypothetical protein L5F33_07655 [Aliarcobacter butzleri]|uniref:hypothetical protein n=1 Tax=Aliarcobacter butzleri TaxID=28197 RepID=UPI001EDE7FAD|nr:hypothetical protein [Aliarcobacter butzleri]MCG3670131.1 hypothetical protein [Aliarcobacter butzleri]
MKNLVIEKAFKYDEKINSSINIDAIYNEKLGFWITEENMPLIESNNTYKPQSKKCDVETGEDRKGE